MLHTFMKFSKHVLVAELVWTACTDSLRLQPCYGTPNSLISLSGLYMIHCRSHCNDHLPGQSTDSYLWVNCCAAGLHGWGRLTLGQTPRKRSPPTKTSAARLAANCPVPAPPKLWHCSALLRAPAHPHSIRGAQYAGWLNDV